MKIDARLTLEKFRQLPLGDPNKQLETLCRRFLQDEELQLLLDIIFDSFTVDESLKGLEMREDRYLKACQREGIEKLKNTLFIYGEQQA